MGSAEYEIEVYNADEQDMIRIVATLWDGDIGGDNRDDIGRYLREGKPRSVFVNPNDVSEAVKLINGLGFPTDEDKEAEASLSNELSKAIEREMDSLLEGERKVFHALLGVLYELSLPRESDGFAKDANALMRVRDRIKEEMAKPLHL